MSTESFMQIAKEPLVQEQPADETPNRIKFFRYAPLFVVGLLAAHFLLNALFLNTYFAEKEVMQTQRQYEAADKSQLSVLAIGDSHLAYAIDPLEMCSETVFNYSSFGENYIESYYKLRHVYEEDGVALSMVIVPFDLHSFSAEKSNLGLNAYTKRFVDYVAVGRAKGDVPEYLKKRIEGELPYLANARGVFGRMLGKNVPKYVQQGHVSGNNDFSTFSQDDIQHEIDALMASHFGTGVFIDEVLLDYFQKLVQLAADNGTSIILMRAPVSKSYFDAASERVLPETYYNEIMQRLPANGAIFVADYHNIYFERDDLFYDANHLNEKGAALFSQQLRADLNICI